MTMKDKKIVTIGKIGAPKGLCGWMKVHSYTQPKQDIIDYQPWLIQRDNHWQAVKVNAHQCSAKTISVQLVDVTDRTTAQIYTNALIGVYREQLPELTKNEYYWTDLEGLTVYTKDDQLLGTVDHLIATGANDVVVVQGIKQYLIPYLLGQTILTIDLANNTMQVDWDPDF